VLTIPRLSRLVSDLMTSVTRAWRKPQFALQAARREPRYLVTDLGRRALAMEALFGPCPSVAETHRFS
jgi:hypothetical protein